MSNTPLLSGVLSQLSQGSNMWRKRFFVLLPDGTISISEKKGATPKQFFYLSTNSDINKIPTGELKGETGFYVNVSSYQLLCVKSPNESDVSDWFSTIERVLKSFHAQAKKRDRLSVSDIYSRMNNAEKNNKGSKVSGYVMKVGKDKDANDFFVSANTFEYYPSEDDCVRGQKATGKASITLLV